MKRKNEILNSYICGDCLDVLKELEDESVHLILTSPPYADQIKNYGKEVTLFNPSEYVGWFVERAREFYRVLDENGSFVLNINDKIDGNFQNLYVFKVVIALCEDVGFHLVRDYIWYNPATPPNVFSKGKLGRTKKSHEYCFWFSKSDIWTFNMDPIRKPYGKEMQKLIDGKHQNSGSRNENTRPSRHNFDLSHAWSNNGGADPGSVITLGNTASNGKYYDISKSLGIKHPARYPEKLARFFVLAGSNEGDTVLDPFAGSGTTGVVAKKNKRNYICIDVNPEFQKLGAAWLGSLDGKDE